MPFSIWLIALGLSSAIFPSCVTVNPRRWRTVRIPRPKFSFSVVGFGNV
jgi:hypothetical protein